MQEILFKMANQFGIAVSGDMFKGRVIRRKPDGGGR